MDDARSLIDRFQQEQREALPVLEQAQVDQLVEYARWLESEAIPAGGLGPNEGDRVVERHVLDSLAFAALVADLPDDVEALDLGSGVGLPGIPLAITFPRGRIELVDRSGRRCRLMRRAIRVLGISNTTVAQLSLEDVSGQYRLVTSRATMPPDRLLPHLRRTVAPGGVAVVAGSASQPIEAAGYVTAEFRSEVLGNSRWMLMMRAT